ncbi:hypothetical protein MXD59_19975 [Frankia sp. Ag45/Mut15]|uniref:Transcriptional regulator, TetR family n=1 Tax=Frankia umida TaxID=573489 RepID=A0ABT0K2L9_9ACTN|nr:hypothetical protein [Frankia umida]MCK9878023.1 hypothetical protein [Frankia umida]
MPDELTDAACHRAGTVTFQIFAGLLPLIAVAAPENRPDLVRELKAALAGYWDILRREPGVSGPADAVPAPAASPGSVLDAVSGHPSGLRP